MATKAITIRVDDSVKEQADRMLDDIGINMTTYIVSSLKALIREQKVPFSMVTTQLLTEQMALASLLEAEKEAADPNTKWIEHKDVFKNIREKYGYEV